MIKKLFLILLLMFLGSMTIEPVFAQGLSVGGTKLEVNFFYSTKCQFCAAEEKFLDTIGIKYPEVKINRYIFNASENRKFLIDLLKKHNAEKYLGLVPLTFVGDEFFLGFDNENGIGKQIEASIQRQVNNLKPPANNQDKNKINLPIIGEINLAEYSLPLQAMVLGFFDGFNICSLGALVLILGLVLILRSRPKIILFGGLYILMTVIVYGILIFLWYQLFYYLGPLIKIMDVFVGILGIGGGVYFFKQFLNSRKADATCDHGTNNKIVVKHSVKIQKIFQETGGVWGLIIGIFIFAAVITIVEFPCSAVVPVLFAGIMAKAKISIIAYISNLILYLVFYMLDEIIIFLIAVFTMTIKIGSSKAMTWLVLIEAIVLFGLGIYYLVGF